MILWKFRTMTSAKNYLFFARTAICPMSSGIILNSGHSSVCILQCVLLTGILNVDCLAAPGLPVNAISMCGCL